jgi:hypothetical protein
LKPKTEASLLFNVFNTNGSFPRHIMTDAQIKLVCNNGPCGEVGANSGAGFMTDKLYENARNYGMDWALELGNPSTPGAAAKAINEGGVNNVIIRIGTASGSDGFYNVNTYINYLKEVASQVNGKVFYAIAGPNEPGDEMWIAPGCTSLGFADVCGEKPDFDKRPRPIEIVNF